MAAASTAGFLKEVIDPVFSDRSANMTDAAFTVLGGTLGASIIIPLKTKKKAGIYSLTLAVRPLSVGLVWRQTASP